MGVLLLPSDVVLLCFVICLLFKLVFYGQLQSDSQGAVRFCKQWLVTDRILSPHLLHLFFFFFFCSTLFGPGGPVQAFSGSRPKRTEVYCFFLKLSWLVGFNVFFLYFSMFFGMTKKWRSYFLKELKKTPISFRWRWWRICFYQVNIFPHVCFKSFASLDDTFINDDNIP